MSIWMIPCSRCGAPIPVPADEIARLPAGAAITVEHPGGECPVDVAVPDAPVRYAVRIEVVKNDDLLMSLSGQVEGPSLVAAWPALTAELNGLWVRLQGAAAVADEDFPEDTAGG